MTGELLTGCEIPKGKEIACSPVPGHEVGLHRPASNTLIIIVYLAVFWVLLPAFLFITGFRLDKLMPVSLGDPAMLSSLGWCLTLPGFLLMIHTMTRLWSRGKGLPISHLPPAEFVAGGAYKYLRHPIYVGYTTAFAGAAVLLHSFWSLAFSTPLLLSGWIAYAVFYEEPVLIQRFGERYRTYIGATPLLLPKGLSRILDRAMPPLADKLSKFLDAWANRTILFQCGNFILVSYGVLIAVGTILFMLITIACLIQHGVTSSQAAIYMAGAVLTTLVASHAFWWLGNQRSIVRQPLFGIRNVGFVSWGNLFGLTLFSAGFAAVFNFPLLGVADDLVRGMFAAYAIGRLGCLTYGCCYGVATGKHGVRYINPAAKVIRERGDCRLPRHPTQIYSFVEGMVLLVLLNLMPYLQISVGSITAAAFLIYPIGRALIEFVRDRKRYCHGIFTSGHLACLIMFLSGWILLFLIPASGGKFSPAPLSMVAFRESWSLAPVVFMVGVIVFFTTSFHWKRVGTW